MMHHVFYDLDPDLAWIFGTIIFLKILMNRLYGREWIKLIPKFEV